MQEEVDFVITVDNSWIMLDFLGDIFMIPKEGRNIMGRRAKIKESR